MAPVGPKAKKTEAGSKKPLVVVAGATGHIGGEVVRELASHGYRVKALVRPGRGASMAAAHRLESLGAHVVFADPTKPDTLVGVADGAEAVVSALGVRSFSRSDGTVWSVDRDATINVWRSAAASKVRTFVLVATFEGRASRRYAAISEAKEQAVDTVMRESRDAGVRFCVLRPTAYFKDMTAWLVDPILAGRPARITGSGSPRINPIDGADLAQLVRECVAEGGTQNRELLVGGPQVYTLRGMAELAAEVAGPAVRGRSGSGDGPSGSGASAAGPLSPTAGGAAADAAAAGAAELVKPRRLWPLRLLAPFARCAAPFSSRAAALADGARFVLYSATHDAVGDPYGRRLLRSAFEARVAAVRAAADAAAAAAAGAASGGATPAAGPGSARARAGAGGGAAPGVTRESTMPRSASTAGIGGTKAK